MSDSGNPADTNTTKTRVLRFQGSGDDVERLLSETQARRAVEDEAIRLGAERADLDNKLADNTEATIDLMHEALAVGIGFDQLARMVGVSRQTLHRWRNVEAKRNA